MVEFVMLKSVSKLITNPLKIPLNNYYTHWLCLFSFQASVSIFLDQKLARQRCSGMPQTVK